jgi:hypothetical protein
MSVGKMDADQMSVGQLSVGQMSVSQVSVGQVSVGRVVFDQKTQIQKSVSTPSRKRTEFELIRSHLLEFK